MIKREKNIIYYKQGENVVFEQYYISSEGIKQSKPIKTIFIGDFETYYKDFIKQGYKLEWAYA